MDLEVVRLLKSLKFILPCICMLGISATSARVIDEEAEDRRTLLIVPFNDYRAVGDEFICNDLGITPGDLTGKIRDAITLNTFININDYYHIPAKVIHETRKDGDPSDYMEMLSATGKENKWQKLLGYYKAYPPKIFRAFSGLESKYGTDCLNSGEPYPGKMHNYYKTGIQDTSKFISLALKYHTGYVLFLDRFEMNTRFRNCLTMENSVYQRDFYLHYTLYDNEGMFLSGGTVGITWQDNSNEYKEELEDNLEYLTDMICARVKKFLI